MSICWQDLRLDWKKVLMCVPLHKDRPRPDVSSLARIQLRKCIKTFRLHQPSTIWPTRRSIMDGLGSPSSAGTVLLLAAAAALFFPESSTTSFFRAFFFSFFCIGGATSCGALSTDSTAAAFSLSTGFFSFFFSGSTFRSIFGALSKSSGIKLKSFMESAELLTEGYD
jgi:hypothetical protein